MPNDSELPGMPPSPIENDDLWLINREDKSYKVTSAQLGGYINKIEIPLTCTPDVAPEECPSGYVCVDGICVRLQCEEDNDCPPDYTCYLGYCWPMCDPVTHEPCTDGHVCVDPGNNNGQHICLPYPFPCRPQELPDDGCPPGYVCWGGYCWKECDTSDPSIECPPGMECRAAPPGQICVPSAGGFPCAEGVCPDGYECFFGMCFARCGLDPLWPNNGVCDEGYICIPINGIDYCVPYPFPCGLYGDGTEPCPPGMICYNNMCYPVCDPNLDPCEDGFSCIQIGTDPDNGAPITICFPDSPPEQYVNDGALRFIDDQENYLTVFTANQFGDTYLRFQGIDINPDSGAGGGSGATIQFNTLWQRVDEGDRWSDIHPTYTLDAGEVASRYINVVPHGIDKSSFGLPDNQWKNVYTSGLRNVNTHGDHIGTGTTSQRPVNRPTYVDAAGAEVTPGPIQAGEIRYNTDRGAQVERLSQAHHSSDLEIYNGSNWVRMEPKAEGSMYNDNYESRLIYGRGLTVEATGNELSKDSVIQSWTTYKTYDPTPLELKLGNGLRFDDDGNVEQGPSGNPGDSIVVPKLIEFERSQGSPSSGGGSPNGGGSVNGSAGGGSFNWPAKCNYGIATFMHKMAIQVLVGNIPIKGSVSRRLNPYTPPATLEEYRQLRGTTFDDPSLLANHSHSVTLDNPINIGWVRGNVTCDINGAGMSVLVGYDQFLNIANKQGQGMGGGGEDGGNWGMKSEEFSVSPADYDQTINFNINFSASTYNAQAYYGQWRLLIQPFEI